MDYKLLELILIRNKGTKIFIKKKLSINSWIQNKSGAIIFLFIELKSFKRNKTHTGSIY